MNNQLKNPQRNHFVALCEYASKNNWCWKITCTTCGHSAFRVSFSKIIRGQHPDDESFWPHGKDNAAAQEEMENDRDFPVRVSGATVANQVKLASIAAEAKLTDIRAVAKFPDWLGYIGLVMYHCPSPEAQKIISDSFLPQFITLVKGDEMTYGYLQEKQAKQQFLDIRDLDRIEVDIKEIKAEIKLDWIAKVYERMDEISEDRLIETLKNFLESKKPGENSPAIPVKESHIICQKISGRKKIKSGKRFVNMIK